MSSVTAYVSIGSNVEPERFIKAGVEQLAQRYEGLRGSSIYRSAAVGFEGDDFLNLVVGFDTDQSLTELLRELHRIEEANGRDRDTPSFGPRTLDLDLLLYGNTVCAEPQLLPRAEIMEHAFVLGPLAEIAGDRPHPVSGIAFGQLWRVFPGGSASLKKVAPPPC